MDLYFENLPLLLLLIVVPALYFLYVKYNSEKKESILKFSSLKIIKKTISKRNTVRRHIPFWLLLGAFCLTVIVLANPQIPTYSSVSGFNLSIILDGSESMAATDYEPTRLEVAKDAIIDLIEKIPPVNNIGVILVESGATTVSYMTPEKDKVISAVSDITQGSGATAIGDGISLGVDMVTSIPDKRNVLILLSDGIHNSGIITPQEAIQYAKNNNIQIFTIGIGSENPVYLRDDIYGEPQYAQLDEDTLKQIAQETGGKYYKSVNEETLNEIFTTLNSNLKYETEYSTIRDWFIIGIIVLLVTNAYIIYGKYRIVV